MPKYISHSENETRKLAEKIAKNTGGNIFTLTGELGAGKTIFAQGFAKSLGIKNKIISPTFVLIKQYGKNFYHIDLYRLENFTQLGLEEILSNINNVVLIEWGEKIEKLLPKNTVKINITKKGSHSRLISISTDPNCIEDKSCIDK